MATHCMAFRSGRLGGSFTIILFFVTTDTKRGLTGSNFDFSNDNANQQMLCFKIRVSTVV